MAAARKKSGLPEEGLVRDPLQLQNLTPLCKYLQEARNMAVTELMLSQFVFKLLQFMETYFGKKSAASDLGRRMVKIPFSVFKDVQVVGGLSEVVEAAARHASISEWLKTDLMEPKNMDVGVELLMSIERRLHQRGMIPRPVFYFGPSVLEQVNASQLVQELSKIAVSHGGSITTDEESANFVVLWDDEVDGILEAELQEEYIRPLEICPNRNNGEALVHWWYHPDSYDEWIPSQDVQHTDTPDEEKYMQLYQKNGYHQLSKHPQVKTYVCCRYLRDVEIFNEWGNLLDYEMDKPSDGFVDIGANTRKSKGKKRSLDRKQHSIQRQQNGIPQNSFIPQSVSVTEKMLQDLPPPSLRDDFNQFNGNCNPSTSEQSIKVVNVKANLPASVKVEAPTNVTRENLYDPVIKDSSDHINNDQPVLKRQRTDAQDSIDDIPDKNSLIQNSGSSCTVGDRAILQSGPLNADVSLLLPSSQLPSWFDTSTISSIEVKHIPELIFEGSSHEQQVSDSAAILSQRSGQKYLSTRNTIVNLYHQNVSTFLTATECRRKIAVDVSFIIRIHEFLDAFGIINYSPTIKVAFRNPKSSIYFSSSNRRSQNLQPANGTTQEQSKGTIWNSHMDKVLLETVASALEAGVLPSDDNCHEVGGINWHKVADIVAAEADQQKRFLFSSVACLVRFTEMSLNNSSTSVPQVTPGSENGLSERVRTYVASASPVSKHVRALASVVTCSAAEILNEMPQVVELAKAIQTTISESHDIPSANLACLSGGTALVSSAAKLATQKKISQAESRLDDYVSLRLSVLEKKMELMGDIEDALLLEKERLDLDRHDLQVERAQHASHVQASTAHTGNMF